MENVATLASVTKVNLARRMNAAQVPIRVHGLMGLVPRARWEQSNPRAPGSMSPQHALGPVFFVFVDFGCIVQMVMRRSMGGSDLAGLCCSSVTSLLKALAHQVQRKGDICYVKQCETTTRYLASISSVRGSTVKCY